jgi:hypothetical protein
VVGPEVATVKRQGARRERDPGEVLDLRHRRTQIDARQPVVGRCLVIGCHQVKRVPDKHLPADAVRHGDDALHPSGRVERQHLFRIPLADVHAPPVEAELRTGVVGTRQRKVRREAPARNATPDDPVVVRRLAA